MKKLVLNQRSVSGYSFYYMYVTCVYYCLLRQRAKPEILANLSLLSVDSFTLT